MWSTPSSGIGSCATSGFLRSARNVFMAQLLDRFVGAGAEEAADDLDHLGNRLGLVEDGLVVRDVVLGGPHLDEVERAVLHAAELVDLAVRRQDPGSVSAHLAVLVDDAELEREPEHPAQEDEALFALEPVRRDAGE